MTASDANRVQAEFWAGAGPLWKQMQAQLDAQVNDHGLAGIDALSPGQGHVVVDVGCGTGTSSFQLAEHVGSAGSVKGLDISPSMVDAARERAASADVSNVSFAVGDAQTVKFEPTADAVFSRFGVMFFTDPVAAFRNLATALKPAGRLGFVCWQSPDKNPWAFKPMEAARQHVDFPMGGDPHAPGPFAFADPERVTSILTDAGCEDVEITASEKPVNMGPDLQTAAELMFRLNPATGALDSSDPPLATTVRSAIAQALSPYLTNDGVEADSAVWIVTATGPAV